MNLNTTARQEERAIEKSSPYLINGTFYVISVDLAYNIGEFNEKKEIEELRQKLDEEAQQKQESAAKQQEELKQAEPPVEKKEKV